MNKNILAVIAVVITVSTLFAQTTVLDKYPETAAEGRPFLTDGALYNSYHLGGSPLGAFEAELVRRLDVGAGYRSFSLGDDKGTYLGSTIRMGEPGRAFFQLFYGPDFLSRGDVNNTRDAADLTMHRFGLAVAGQASSGFFRGALSAEGYMGTQNFKDGDSTRSFMGFDRIRIDMGSRPHPLVRVGFFINGTLHFDSLKLVDQDPDVRREYSVQTNLPEIGGSVDFGGEDMPVRSVLTLSHAWGRFVYGAKGLGLGGVPDINQKGDAPAIMADSFHLYWMTQARFPVMGDDIAVKPALLIGFSNAAGKMHEPDEENDPLKIGDVKEGHNFGLGGFHFGVGAGAEVFNYAEPYIEYSLASMSLTCGDKLTRPETDKRMLHRTAFGVSSSIHKYVDMPIEVTPRIAYFIDGSAGIVKAPHSDIDPLNNTPLRSRADLYQPHLFLEGFTRTSGFTIGVDGTALDKMLSASYWMTFLTKKTSGENKSGTELGLSF